jgi:hypothetical protein
MSGTCRDRRVTLSCPEETVTRFLMLLPQVWLTLMHHAKSGAMGESQGRWSG